MRLKSATRVLAFFLAPYLMLTALGSAAPAGECLHCPKTLFCRPKPPHVKYKCVCPKPIDCANLQHFGYYPTCWNAWPFAPDYSHCPFPPVVAAAPSAVKAAPPSGEELPAPKTIPTPKQPSLQ